MNSPDDPGAWAAKARSDLLNIRNNLAAGDVPWDTVCFHAQQAAEKYLKAFLVSQGRTTTRTHDLVMLLAECRSTGTDLNILETDCLLLSRYGVVFRYPGPEEEPSEQDGREAIAAAERVQAAIEPLLGEAGNA